MSVWCSCRGGFARGRGHGFEPRQPRSVAALREKIARLAGGWLAGGVSPIKKFFFLFIFGFYVLTRKTSVTICAGTRSLAGAPPASKDPFYLPAQIVCGLVTGTKVFLV
jgi:hypothetical protein